MSFIYPVTGYCFGCQSSDEQTRSLDEVHRKLGQNADLSPEARCFIQCHRIHHFFVSSQSDERSRVQWVYSMARLCSEGSHPLLPFFCESELNLPLRPFLFIRSLPPIVLVFKQLPLISCSLLFSDLIQACAGTLASFFTFLVSAIIFFRYYLEQVFGFIFDSILQART